eukprot:2028764-Amphidinium_carterae.1
MIPRTPPRRDPPSVLFTPLSSPLPKSNSSSVSPRDSRPRLSCGFAKRSRVSNMANWTAEDAVSPPCSIACRRAESTPRSRAARSPAGVIGGGTVCRLLTLPTASSELEGSVAPPCHAPGACSPMELEHIGIPAAGELEHIGGAMGELELIIGGPRPPRDLYTSKELLVLRLNLNTSLVRPAPSSLYAPVPATRPASSASKR